MPTVDADLLDLALEDDALLPPSLLDDFAGFRLSVYEGSVRPAATSNDNLLGARVRERTLGRSRDYENNRQSLSWHSAFLTNEGILDAEELMLYNLGLKEAAMLPSQAKSSNKKVQKSQQISSRSYSMPTVTAKRTTAGESRIGHKKSHSWLSSSVISSSVSSFSSGSAKNMFKSSMSFLKKKVGSGSSASSASSISLETPSRSSSTKSKINNLRAKHPGCKSMPNLPSRSSAPTNTKDMHSPWSPSTPPHKEILFTAAGPKLSAQSMSLSFTPPAKETMFPTPSSKPSGMRLPSARFGFFDLEERPSSRWEQIFYSAPAAISQEPLNDWSETTELNTSFWSRTASTTLKLQGSVPSVPFVANEKENKCKMEARIDGLSKLLSSIGLESDLVIDLQGKKGAIQLCLTDDSATHPPKTRRSALASVRRRTPLSAYNRRNYTSASCHY